MLLLKNVVAYWLEGIAYTNLFLAILFFYWKGGNSIRYKIVSIFLLTISILAVSISVQKGVSNSLQYSLIYLFNTFCWCSFFYLIYDTNLKKILAVIIAALTLLYFIYKNILLEFDLIFDSLGQVISSIGIVIFVFLFLNQILSNVKSDPISNNFDFWIASSMLIYHLGAFGIFLTFNHFTSKILDTPFYNKENREILTYLWGVHNVLLFLASLLTWVGVLWIVYRRKSISS